MMEDFQFEVLQQALPLLKEGLRATVASGLSRRLEQQKSMASYG